MDIISLNGLRACPINPSMRIMQNNRMMQIVLCLHDDTIRFLETQNITEVIGHIPRRELIHRLKLGIHRLHLLTSFNMMGRRINHALLRIANRLLEKFIETESNYMFQACQTRYKHDAFNKMYSVWYDACSDPAHELCKRRISREFNELVHSYGS